MLKFAGVTNVFCGILLIFFASAVEAAGEIQIQSLERFVVANGRGIATLSFEIRNQSRDTQRLVERIALPEGWRSLSSLAPFSLGVGEQDIRLVHVSVPVSAGSGTFPIKYFVQGRNDSNINGREEVQVKVLTVVGAELSHSELPAVLLPGEAYSIDFQIKNTGNKRETYSFRVRDKDGFVKKITPRNLSLEPGEKATVVVQGKTLSRLKGSKDHSISLVAQGGSKSSEIRVKVPTVSRIPVGLGKYHKLGGRLSATYSADKDGDSDWYLNYQARGAIDSKGEHYVSLEARTGDSNGSNSSSYYHQDYFQLRYRTSNWESILGHHGFYTNQLSGHGLNGVGAEVQYSPRDKKGYQRLKVRAFKGQSRDDSISDEKTTGIEAKYRFNKDKFEVGLSLLNHEKDGITYDVKSVTGAWSSKYANLKGAYARDNNDDARSFDFNTSWKQLGFNLSHRQGGAQYSGGYQDRRENQAGLNWRYKSNSIRVTASETRNNLDEDPSKQILDTNRQSIRASRTFGEKKNRIFSVGYRTGDQIDLRSTSLKTIDRTVEASFLEYKHNFNDFGLSTKLEYGERDDRIEESGSGSRQEIAVNWRKSEDLDLRLTYSRNDNLNFSGGGEKFGVNGSYDINGRQRLAGYWQRNEGETSSSDSIGLSYSHRFFNNHQVSLNASYINSTNLNGSKDDDSQITLNYSMPLDIPLRRRKDVGSVKGRAVYGKTNQPAKDMVLQLGNHYAVTDNDGKFYYPDIFAKDYTLQIDTSRGSVGNYVLNNSGAAVTVGVEPNKVKELNIALEPGASLAGRLRTFEIDKSAALQKKEGVTETGGLAGVLVELQPVSSNLSQDNLQRTLTNGEGEFNFLGVAPGKWQVVVVDKLPDDYRLERRSLTVDLKAEESTEVLLKALPRVQTIERIGPAGGFSVSG